MLGFKGKTVFGVMLALLLTSMLTLKFNIQPAKASGTIYIRADGSIDPSDAPIITYDNITYALADNIISSGEGIVIERDNIVVHGAGYTLQGTRNFRLGIDLSERTNVTVQNTQIKYFSPGIRLYESSNNSISGNNITENDYDGIWLQHSYNNTISGNNLKVNTLHGIWLNDSSNNTFYHNNFSGHPYNVWMEKPCYNFWDDGYPSGGNYWSDYTGVDLHSGPYQNETGSDGIGDSPYSIDENNTDRYPLMHPYVLLGDLNLDEIVDMWDAIQAASAFGTTPEHSNWNPKADLNADDVIDIFDIIILAGNFGKKA